MNFGTSLMRSLAVCFAAILFAAGIFGQQPTNQPGQSFDFILHLVEGGQNSTVKAGLPSGWDGIEKDLRSTFSLKGFSNVGTFVTRGATEGAVSNEGSWNSPGVNGRTMTIIRYSITGISQAGGKIVARTANFDLRVPPVVNVQEPAKSRDDQTVKLFISNLAFEPNMPIVLGSFCLAGIDGPIFAVLTAVPK
ncbi:MAG: hypothetical protein IT171_05450 [Acidobacteria bacterium]|nr:hypothetical protein [Acidobacteriota bacterium]